MLVLWQLLSLLVNVWLDDVAPVPHFLVVRVFPVLALGSFPLVLRAASALVRRRGHIVRDPGGDATGQTAVSSHHVRALLFSWIERTRRRFAPPVALGILLFAAAARVVSGPVLPCRDRPADCYSYVKMVEDLSYDPARHADDGPWPEYGAHHFMRILPPLLVRGVMMTGLGVDDGFRVVSAAAYLAFTLSLWGVLARAVFLFGVPGIMTKQNLLALSTLSLAFLWVRSAGPRRRAEIAALTVAALAFYIGLARYYHASSTVTKHLVPGGGFDIVEAAAFAIDAGGLELGYVLVPLLPWYGRDALRFLVRNWNVGLYAVIAVAQPILAYSITGAGNVERIALQGVWPVYFAVAYAAATRPESAPALLRWMLLPYALWIYGHWGVADRLASVAGMLAVGVAGWFLARSALAGKQPEVVPR